MREKAYMEKVGRYLSLEDLCTCTQTYQKFADQVVMGNAHASERASGNLLHPYPKNPVSIHALTDLAVNILDPLIDHYGRDRFQLTYGFCSSDLKRFLEKRDPVTGEKNGIVSPNLDQHMAHELNRNGKPYCQRLGASADFRILGVPSDLVVDWILAEKIPFDSLYFYSSERPIHISYGPQHKRDIWTFLETGQPTRKGIQHWVEMAQNV